MTRQTPARPGPSRRSLLGLAASGLVAAATGARAETLPALPPKRSEIVSLPELPIVRPQFVPRDPGQFFFAQNAINDNVLVYATRLGADGALDAEEPMTVYWRRYSEEGQRRDLNFFERNFALGLATETEGPGRWSVRMVGWRDRAVRVERGGDGRARATVEIDGRALTPLYVWVEAYGSHFIPSIRHVDLFARAESGRGVVRERIFFE